MALETVITEDAGAEAPPPPKVKITKRETPAALDAEGAVAPKIITKVEPLGVSPEMREHARNIDKSIRTVIESLNGVPFKIRLMRKEPDEVPDATGKMIPCAGFLKEFDGEIDEETIQRKYGGGKYELEFKKPGPKGGWVYGGHTTLTIAGEPNVAELPRAVRQQQQPQQQGGADSPNTAIVKDVMGLMSKQLEKAEERANNANSSGPNDAVMQLLRDQISSKDKDLAALRQEMRDLATRLSQPPPKSTEDTVKDKLLDKLMDGDSARLTAVRTQYESEIRTTKENAREDEKRLIDRHQRELDEIRRSHDREIQTLRSSHEIAMATTKSSAELQVATAKSSFETQIALVRDELTRLRTENSELRTEVKELRAKKDKSPIEMLKDVKLLKEALGEDGDDAEESTVGKIMEAVANPGTWEGIGSLIGRARGQAEAAAQQPQPKAGGKRRVIRLPNGSKAMLLEDGKTVVPIQEEKQPPAADGTPAEPQMPKIDPVVIDQIVKFLESAFEGGQEPTVVAQGARSRVPEDLVTAIRDHGVDAVMAKMAKLSSTSPLSTQRGRVWMRDLGKALVGE